MAARSWATSILTAIGVAAGAAAAQLGIGYGLAIIAWQTPAGATPSAATTIWVNSLAWVTWLAATATVLGALFADRVSSVDTPVTYSDEGAGAQLIRIAWRIVISLAAAVGALLTVPLVALPARTPRPDNVTPYFTAGGYAVAGVIIGLLVAIGALTARAFAANVIASAACVFVLAVLAVVGAVHGHAALPGSAQLAVWKFTDAVWVRGMVNLPGALLMLAISLVIGGLAAWPAGRRGDNRVGVAISGAGGPILVAGAYFLAAPVLDQHDQHLSAFVMAPYAVLAGLAGSVLVAAIGPKGHRTKVRAERRASTDDRDARAAADLTNWNQAVADAERAREGRADETARSGSDFLASVDEPRYVDEPRVEEPAPRKAGRATVPTFTDAEAPVGEDSTVDLADDGYAPSRAYSGKAAAPGSGPSQYAADTVEPETPVTAVARPSSGAPKQPLWPSTATTETPKPAPTSKGRGRRGPKDDPAE